MSPRSSRSSRLRIGRTALLAAVLACAWLAQLPRVRAADAERVVLPASVVPLHYEIELRPDAARMRFASHVRIDVEVRAPTRTITLNAANLEFGAVRLTRARTPATAAVSAGAAPDSPAASAASATPRIQLDEKLETATFTFPRELAPGAYALDIDYRGRINQNPAGLFALDYTAADKSPRRALFTQFENSDARRFVPCWDEPGIRSSVTLTAIVPKDQLAVSNMPVARSTAAGAELMRVQFLTTPKMSMYLLFFAVGDLERIHRKVGKIDLGVIVKRGATANATFALDAGAQLLPYFEDYFGVPFPLPKLDFIAGPGLSEFFGAMENWGAIFYFEKDLLIDARTSTLADRQNVYVSVAHEMAHQWFGDLVTMAWWDDLWLNEGFASWMEKKATDALNPQWSIWLQDAASRQEAMKIDAAAGTHPVITPIHDVVEAASAFDTITYSKGADVIRMLEAYVGSDVFREGVRRYLRAHAYGNTVTDDFWKELDAVSPRRVTEMAHDFTLHPGVPLVSVDDAHCAHGTESVGLHQTRFAVDESGRAGAQVWHVPLEIRALQPDPRADEARASGVETVVSGARGTTVVLPGCGPVLVNAGQASYVRVLYSSAGLAALAEHFAGLAPEDQLGVLNDAAVLAETGNSPMAGYLDLLTRVPRSANPVVWLAVTGQLRELDHLYAGLPGQKAFRDFAAEVVRPVGRMLGWDPKAGEADNAALERSSVLSALGEFGDADTIAEAHRRFALYLKSHAALTAASRKMTLDIVARRADAQTWQALHALARKAHTSQEQEELYSLLALTDDRNLVHRMHEIAISDELPATLRPVVLRSASAWWPADTFTFAVDHWSALEPLLEPDFRFGYLPRILQSASDETLIPRLEAFNAGHKVGRSGRGDSDRAIARIRYNAAVRARLGEVDRWIRAHPAYP